MSASHALLAALFGFAGAGDEAPTPDATIDVVTVDDAGRPAGGIGVELQLIFDTVFLLTNANTGKPSQAEPRRFVAFTDADGRARFSDPLIALWRHDATREAGAKSLPRTQAWVRALVPLGTSLSWVADPSSHAPTRLQVETIESVELRVRDVRQRPVPREADFGLRFDAGDVVQTFSASDFAPRSDRLVVPIPAAKLASAHVRAARGNDRSPRVALKTADRGAIGLDFAPGPRITGTLRSPAGEPVAASSPILVAPVHPRLPRTCMRYGQRERQSSTGWTFTAHDSARVDHEGTWQGSIDARRIDESKTGEDGAFSIVLPLDPSSAGSTYGLEDRAAPTVLRIEVHHEDGQCWLADVPFDATLDSGATDIGTVVLAPDSRMVCGRVVDDRGEPIQDAHLRWTESVGGVGRDGVTSTSADTDVVGRFRIGLSEARAMTAHKVGHLSPPPLRLEPGTIGHTIVLERCATLQLVCNPPTTLVPERFEVRWRRADVDDRARLHHWNATIGGLPSGDVTMSLMLAGVATPVAERTLALEPGNSQSIDVDLRDCGLVTLRVMSDGGGLPIDARVLLNGTNRSLELDGTGVARFAIATPTVALTIRAPGFADSSGVFGHGEHTVVLMPAR